MNAIHGPEDEALVRYLLGTSLTEAEVERIEGSYFSDDRYFEHLLSVEDELIDGHIRGVLPPELREPFEKHFLSAKRRREKWEAQRAIARFFHGSAKPSFLAGLRRFWNSQGAVGRLAATAIGAVVVASLAILGVSYLRVNRQAEQLRAQLTTAEWPLTHFSLAPGVRRGSSKGADLQLASRSGTVLFHLKLEKGTPTFSSYAVVLRSDDGEEVYRLVRIPPKGFGLDVSVPDSVLIPGDYVLAVKGINDHSRQELQSFVFRIVP